jgi:chromosomal replication initiation ATPase DnaA
MELTIDITLEQAVEVCESYGYTVIENSQLSPKDLLSQGDIKRLAARINHVSIAQIESRNRNENVVFARWMVAYYYLEFSTLTLATIGYMIKRDHSNVVHIRKEINNIYLDGWRLKNRSIFKREINNIHESLGLKSKFN